MEYLSALCAVFTLYHVLFFLAKSSVKRGNCFPYTHDNIVQKQVIGRKSGNFENCAI